MMKKVPYILLVIPIAFIVTHFIGLLSSIAHFDLNKHYLPIKEVWKDGTLVTYGAMGYGMISIFFLSIGTVMIVYADKGLRSTETKIKFTRYVGFAFVSCGILRMMELIGIWMNLAVMTIIISNITGIMAGIAVFMLPKVLVEAKEQRRLEDVEKKIHDARNVLQKVTLFAEGKEEKGGNE